MSKERLEEIVEKIAEQLYDRIVVPETKVTIEYQDIKYLFNTIEEQSERVQESEELVEDYKAINKELHQRGKRVRKQNKRYREALEFYADKMTYTDKQHTSTGQLVGTGYITIMFDKGKKARKALEGEE